MLYQRTLTQESKKVSSQEVKEIPYHKTLSEA